MCKDRYCPGCGRNADFGTLDLPCHCTSSRGGIEVKLKVSMGTGNPQAHFATFPFELLCPILSAVAQKLYGCGARSDRSKHLAVVWKKMARHMRQVASFVAAR